MKKRKTIIESAIRLLGPNEFDVTPTLEVSFDPHGMKMLIYYFISLLVDLPKQTTAKFPIFTDISFHYFQSVNDLPDQMQIIYRNIPEKLNDSNCIFQKNTNTQKFVMNYVHSFPKCIQIAARPSYYSVATCQLFRFAYKLKY